MPDNLNPINQAVNLVNVESLINNFRSKMDEVSAQLKDYRSQLNSIFENDPEYMEQHEQHTHLTKEKKIAKQKVLQKPEAKELEEKISALQTQLKEAKEALSDYLNQYIALSGSKQIETPDGALLEIVSQSKLVRKKD